MALQYYLTSVYGFKSVRKLAHMPGVQGICMLVQTMRQEAASALTRLLRSSDMLHGLWPGATDMASSCTSRDDLASDALWAAGAPGYEAWVCGLVAALLSHASSPILRMCAPDCRRGTRMHAQVCCLLSMPE